MLIQASWRHCWGGESRASGSTMEHASKERMRMASPKHLFSPIKIGALEVRSRIVVSPMRKKVDEADDTFTKPIMDSYEASAKGELGLNNYRYRGKRGHIAEDHLYRNGLRSCGDDTVMWHYLHASSMQYEAV